MIFVEICRTSLKTRLYIEDPVQIRADVVCQNEYCLLR